MKIPISKLTSKLKRDINGNSRSLENLVMNGDAVYLFILNTVPRMIYSLLKKVK